MTQEEKQLLLKDLCARLPYGVNLYIEEPKKLPDNEHISVGFIGGYALNKEGCQDFLINDVLESLDNGSVVKPYLRPLSNMTEEEQRYIWDKFGPSPIMADFEDTGDVSGVLRYCNMNVCDANFFVDWLNAHHFDYRGLIEKGLALEAPEGMYQKIS